METASSLRLLVRAADTFRKYSAHIGTVFVDYVVGLFPWYWFAVELILHLKPCTM